MKVSIKSLFVVLVCAVALAGCGRSREEAERERQRLELEQQAQRDLKKSNDAVNEVSKKLGRKPPPLAPALVPETKTAPASEPARKP